MERRTLIGFGDAAHAFASSAGGQDAASAFDIKTRGHALRANTLADYAAVGMRGCENLAEALVALQRILVSSSSLNNDGPLGTFFRYICDSGTWIARYDDLVTGREEPVDVSQIDASMNGIELQNREFVSAIREIRESNSSVARVMSRYRVLGAFEAQLNG